MRSTVYVELPIDKIEHLNRSTFIDWTEKDFRTKLKNSMAKHGMKDPIFAYEYVDGTIKTIVGNNRMVIAKELGIKTIRCIVTQMKSETSSLKGRILNTDQEILDLHPSPEIIEIIRRDEGWVAQVNSQLYKSKNWVKYA